MGKTLKILPYARQSIDEADIATVAEALRGDFLTTGPLVERLEKAIAAYLGVTEFVVCNSGTSALHIAALAAGLGKGDKAIVPSMTFVATANAVRMTGAEVIFADVNAATGLMEPAHFENAIALAGGGVKAVFPVHLKGQCADMKAIATVAKAHDIKVITDACHALGGIHLDNGVDRAPLGSCTFEDIACFSFHPAKAIAMGEGGGISTNDLNVAALSRQLRSHGIRRDAGAFINKDMAFDEKGQPNPWYYECQSLGYNFRVPDILCALALSQFEKLDQFIAHRSHIADLYDQGFAGLNAIKPPLRSAYSRSGHHLYALRIDFVALGMSRAAVIAALLEKGIGTQVHYIPVHYQPFYKDIAAISPLPGAESYYAETLSIPLHLQVTDEDAMRVVKAVRDLL
jgi:UDP-4-amino-4,6-dideoxy-N-acetyl-beta-L-altrosamine transaminase